MLVHRCSTWPMSANSEDSANSRGLEASPWQRAGSLDELTATDLRRRTDCVVDASALFAWRDSLGSAENLTHRRVRSVCAAGRPIYYRGDAARHAPPRSRDPFDPPSDRGLCQRWVAWRLTQREPRCGRFDDSWRVDAASASAIVETGHRTDTAPRPTSLRPMRPRSARNSVSSSSDFAGDHRHRRAFGSDYDLAAAVAFQLIGTGP